MSKDNKDNDISEMTKVYQGYPNILELLIQLIVRVVVNNLEILKLILKFLGLVQSNYVFSNPI